MKHGHLAIRWCYRALVELAPVLVAFAASRLLVFGIILLSRLIVAPGPFSHDGGYLTTLLLGGAVPFLEVARDGYPTGPGSEWGMGIFPTYPLFVKIVSLVLHNFALAGVVTANLSLLAAGVLLYRLMMSEYGNAETARAGVIFLMFNPASVFYAGAHPNSAFLMLALASLYAAVKGHWLAAALSGIALAATHRIGVLILFPLLVELAHQKSQHAQVGREIAPTRRTTGWWLALIPLAPAAFIWFGYARFPDSTAVATAIRHWTGAPANPWSNLFATQTGSGMFSWLLPPIVAASLLLWVAGFALNIRRSLMAYATLLIVLSMCSTILEPTPRNIGLVFPLFMTLGLIAARWKWTYEPLLTLSVAALSFCTMLEANGYWFP